DQALHVCRRRILTAGPQHLVHAGPAHDLAPFEDEHPAARPAEIGGRDQTVVTGPDDDGIVADGHDTDSPATCNTCRPATQRPRRAPELRGHCPLRPEVVASRT